jgi:hypothetical protein
MLRIVGVLLLVSGTSAARSHDRLGQHQQRQARLAPHRLPATTPPAAPTSAPRTSAAHAQHRDATGRSWSEVDLGARSTRSVDGNTWTTQRFGGWSYWYASDGTSCVSRRAAQTVFISCR